MLLRAAGSKPSNAASAGAVVAGRLESASMNGGKPVSSGLPELIERIPTMMIGTSLPSVLLSSCGCEPEAPLSVNCLVVSAFRELGPSTVPSLNILKKFS